MSTQEHTANSIPEKQRVIKLLVWDLDNTLWKGVLSEGDELVLNESAVAAIRDLDERGILHSIASKNNHEDAWAQLCKFGLDGYFLYPQINWGPKSESIGRVKEKINIGFNAIAFIDDQPFEREEVSFVHPEVWALDETKIDLLTQMPELMPRFITGESARRREMYQADAERNEEEARFGNNQEFLEQLDMKFHIAPASLEDLRRVEELTLRTNQLNATGYTYSYEELETLLDSEHYLLLVAELVDRYGSYGKIGVVLVEKGQANWVIKLMLMSCRVMSRGVGTVLLHYLINRARREGVGLQAEFKPTDRNRIMNITYKFAGFREVEKLDSGGDLLGHPLDREYPFPAYIKTEIKE